MNQRRGEGTEKEVWQGKTVGVGKVFYSLDIAVGHGTSGFGFSLCSFCVLYFLQVS